MLFDPNELTSNGLSDLPGVNIGSSWFGYQSIVIFDLDLTNAVSFELEYRFLITCLEPYFEMTGTYGRPGTRAQFAIGEGLPDGTPMTSGDHVVQLFEADTPFINGDSPLACPCEADGVEGVTVDDLLAFLALWFQQLGMEVLPGVGPDKDGDGIVQINDLLAFLSCWFSVSGTESCELP